MKAEKTTRYRRLLRSAASSFILQPSSFASRRLPSPHPALPPRHGRTARIRGRRPGSAASRKSGFSDHSPMPGDRAVRRLAHVPRRPAALRRDDPRRPGGCRASSPSGWGWNAISSSARKRGSNNSPPPRRGITSSAASTTSRRAGTWTTRSGSGASPRRPPPSRKSGRSTGAPTNAAWAAACSISSRTPTSPKNSATDRRATCGDTTRGRWPPPSANQCGDGSQHGGPAQAGRRALSVSGPARAHARGRGAGGHQLRRPRARTKWVGTSTAPRLPCVPPGTRTRRASLGRQRTLVPLDVKAALPTERSNSRATSRRPISQAAIRTDRKISLS